jgi:hypothetical protein
MLTAAVLLLTVLIGAAAASADTGATLYVDQHNPSCSDTGAGKPAQPFCTISAAAAKTAPGMTVLISTGTYAETVKPPVSGTPGNPITYRAAPGANVMVTGSSLSAYTFEIAGQSWITVKGLSLSHGSGGPVVEVMGSNVSITGNQVSGEVELGGASVSQVSVTDNHADSISASGATGVDIEDNTAGQIEFGIPLVTNGRIVGNSTEGITLLGSQRCIQRCHRRGQRRSHPRQRHR